MSSTASWPPVHPAEGKDPSALRRRVVLLALVLGAGCDAGLGDPRAVPEVGARCNPAADSPDRDCDGLDDQLEVAIARHHAPWFRFAGARPGEGELDSPWKADLDSGGECDDFGCLTGCADPRDHLLADLGVPAPWSQVRKNGAWPFSPYLRAPAPVRVTPSDAFALTHVAYGQTTGDPDGPGAPWGWFFDAECPGGSCSSHCDGDPLCRWIDDQPQNQGYLMVRISLAFAADPGKRIDGVTWAEHLGDTETMTETLVRDARCDPDRTAGGDGYRVVEIATAAHYNDSTMWESIHRYRVPEELGCAWGASFVARDAYRADDLSLGFRDGVIWVNNRKHGLYGTADDCEDGGDYQDECNLPGYFQTIDPIDIGEPGANRVVGGRATEDPDGAGHIAADDPRVNPIAARAIPVPWGGDGGVFPGEDDPWAAEEGGFSGGFRSERLYGACAVDRGQMAGYWMKDPLVHKFIGDVSPATGHSALSCFPGGALQPPFIAAVSPSMLAPDAPSTVTLEGQFPPLDEIESVTVGGVPCRDLTALATSTRNDCEGLPAPYVTRLSFTAPPPAAAAAGPVPIVITRRPSGPDNARVQNLVKLPGSPGWVSYRAPSSAAAQ